VRAVVDAGGLGRDLGAAQPQESEGGREGVRQGGREGGGVQRERERERARQRARPPPVGPYSCPMPRDL
jgi:hypothetical protein